MSTWKTAALAAAFLGAAAAGAAVAPVAHGQTTPAPRKVAPRAVQIFGGGSYLGVSIRDMTDEDAKTAKLSAPAGVLIEEVTAESPAEKAGMKAGDAVVEFDGEKVRSARHLTRLVQETAAGRKVGVAVLRAGQRVSLTVEPQDSDGNRLSVFSDGVVSKFGRDFTYAFPTPPAPPAPPAAPVPPNFDSFIWRFGSNLGITVGDLSPQLGEYFGTKEGVLVTGVTADSAASKAGLRAGDVVTAFNGATITTQNDLRRRIQRLEAGDEFTIAVVRDKKPVTLKGKIEAPVQKPRTIRSIV
jgi:serine protease Do